MKTIIEYVGGTKGDMLCRFLNNAESTQTSIGKSTPMGWRKNGLNYGPYGINWLKLINPYELTLERFEDVLSENPYEFLSSHPLWVTYDKNYRDLLKKYNYKISSIKFEPKHYVTIQIEGLLKNMLNRVDEKASKDIIVKTNTEVKEDSSKNPQIRLYDIFNILFFEKKEIPEWIKKDAATKNINFEDLDIFKEVARTGRIQNILKNISNNKYHNFYEKNARIFRSFNEMTENRTILNYEDLYLGQYPFSHLPDREKEWNDLVENSWCDYDENGYREFDEPGSIKEINSNIYTKTVIRYLEQWKNLD